MSDIWQTLADHRAATKDTPLAALFDQDAQRFAGLRDATAVGGRLRG